MNGGRVAVVGAGIAGLAAARALVRDGSGLDVVVLERARRVGGLVDTERTPEGFLLEHGADCLMTTTPWGIRTAREVGLGEAIVTIRETLRRYILKDDTLAPLPHLLGGAGPGAAISILRTPLLPTRGKLRALIEPLAPRGGLDGDESVRTFVTRRFGSDLLEAVFEPLLSGIYGSDTARLSVDVCLPRLRDFERRDGSILLGMRRVLRERRRRRAQGAALFPPMVSLRDGMASLPAAVGETLRGCIRLGVEVRTIDRSHGAGFRLHTTAGSLDCDALVLAVPAWRAPEMLARLDQDLAAALADVPHNAMDCVSLGWRRRDVPRPLDGTGFVRATGERRPTQACTWASEKWPGRAPADHVLVRSVLSMSEAADADVVEHARRDLRDLLGVAALPHVVRIRRLPRATPVYTVGHMARVDGMRERARSLGALGLAGNAYGGVGIPDCIRSGEDAARDVLRVLADRGIGPWARAS